MHYLQTDIAKGVKGIFIENDRFNTTYISVNFFLPVLRAEQSKRVVLPYILTSCSQKYKTYTELNRALADLYSADIYASTQRIGNCVCIKIALSTINDRFALNGQSSVKQSVDLLMSLIFNPKVENASFFEENLNTEKRKTEEQILSEMNDKRAYSADRLLSEMFKNSEHGVGRYGSLEDVKKIDGKNLFDAYEELLRSAFVTVNVIGEKLPDGLFERISDCFSGIKRENITDVKVLSPLKATDSINYVTERQNVLQGKLGMGFSLDTKAFSQSEALIFADIFGGGPYSKLFSNVREKMSLCYYCNASVNYGLGYLTVNSGVEAINAEKAQNEIINQLTAIKNGDFGDFEISSSKKAITDNCKSHYDNQSLLDRWYTSRVIYDGFLSPNEYAQTFEEITKENIINIAKTERPNTVYKLLPQEEK